MKKLLCEDSFGLKNKLAFRITVLSLFIFTETYSQIPVNGFCRFKEFVTRPGLTEIFSVDLNSDGFRDLLLPDLSSNKVIVQQANSSGDLNLPRDMYTSFGISNLHSFDSESGKNRRYAFVSRRTKTAGLIAFSPSGVPSVIQKIKLKSFPSDLDVADIDGDGVKEIVISGSTFGGISILKFNKNKISEIHLEKNRLLSGAIFSDFDYDGFPDLACFDVFRKSIVFFYNDQTGNFREMRSVTLKPEAEGFSAADFNSDGFNDFIYTSPKGFEVLLGDSVSSYSQSSSMKTETKPGSFTIYDFNGDGFNDIGFIDETRSSFYISFAINSQSFYPPVFYFSRPGISRVIAYIDRNGKKAAVLSREGKIYIIDSFRLSDKENSVALASNPGAIATFDYQNDKFKDICLIDNSDNSLKFLLSSGRKLISTYYSYPVSYSHSNILVDDSNAKIKTFYCFSYYSKLIEIVTADFDKNSFSRRLLYTDGPILDLKISNNAGDKYQKIFALVNHSGKTEFQKFQYHDFRYLRADKENIGEGSIDAAIDLDNGAEFYSLVPVGNDIIIRKTSLHNDSEGSRDYDLKIAVPDFGQLKAAIKSFRFSNDINEKQFAVITSGGQGSLVTLNSNKFLKIPINVPEPDKGKISVSYSPSEKKKKLYLYDGKMNQIMQYEISNGGKADFVGALKNLPGLNSYVVTDLYRAKQFLVYSDGINNLIGLKILE